MKTDKSYTAHLSSGRRAEGKPINLDLGTGGRRDTDKRQDCGHEAAEEAYFVVCGTLYATTCYTAVNTLLGFLKTSYLLFTSLLAPENPLGCQSTQLTSKSQLTNDHVSSKL